jgi:hypothetical protein
MNGIVACTITVPGSGLYCIIRIYRLPGFSGGTFQAGSWDWIGGTFNYIESPDPRRWGYFHNKGTSMPVDPWTEDILQIRSFRLLAPTMDDKVDLFNVPKNFLDTVPSNPLSGEGEVGHSVKVNWSIWFRTDPL